MPTNGFAVNGMVSTNIRPISVVGKNITTITVSVKRFRTVHSKTNINTSQYTHIMINSNSIGLPMLRCAVGDVVESGLNQNVLTHILPIEEGALMFILC